MAAFTVKAQLKESPLCGLQRGDSLRAHHLIGEQCYVSGEQEEPGQTALTRALCNGGKSEQLAEKNANAADQQTNWKIPNVHERHEYVPWCVVCWVGEAAPSHPPPVVCSEAPPQADHVKKKITS